MQCAVLRKQMNLGWSRARKDGSAKRHAGAGLVESAVIEIGGEGEGRVF